AAGLRLRVGGAVAGRNQVRLPGDVLVRAEYFAGVPRAGGAVRELDTAVYYSAGRAAGGVRRAQRAAAARLLQRRVLPGGAGDADRAGGEELDPDRGVRRAAAVAGAVDHRRRDRVGAHPA